LLNVRQLNRRGERTCHLHFMIHHRAAGLKAEVEYRISPLCLLTYLDLWRQELSCHLKKRSTLGLDFFIGVVWHGAEK
jgi:hypothetical protein